MARVRIAWLGAGLLIGAHACSLTSLDGYFDGRDAGVADAAAGEGGSAGAGGVAGCGPGQKPCAGACVSASTPELGCESPSCDPCPALPHVNVLDCDVNGACAPGKCEAGWEDCDDLPANGCEIDLDNDVNHCGTCGKQCTGANGTNGCALGQCTITCDPGFANCDSLADNGCEIDIRTDKANCGACGTVCSGTQSCEKEKCCNLHGQPCGTAADCCAAYLCNGTCCISLQTC